MTLCVCYCMCLCPGCVLCVFSYQLRVEHKRTQGAPVGVFHCQIGDGSHGDVMLDDLRVNGIDWTHCIAELTEMASLEPMDKQVNTLTLSVNRSICTGGLEIMKSI